MLQSAKPLGQLLIAAGLIDERGLQDALQLQEVLGCRLGEALVRGGAVAERDLTQVLSNQLSVAWVSLEHVGFTDALLAMVSRELARQHRIVPVHARQDAGRAILYLAMDDPTNVEIMRQVSAYAGMNVRPLIAPPTEIRRVVEQYYPADVELGVLDDAG